MDRKYISGEKVIKFWSNAKKGLHELSNFHGVCIEFRDKMFPSVEHAYQSCKFKEMDRFSIKGDIDFKSVYGSNYVSKKKYWMKKNNIGIVAKMASKPNISKCLGLTIDETFKSTPKLWLKLLYEKFKIEKFKKLLLNTGDDYLLEFGRGCKSACENGNVPFWNGSIVGNKLYGLNTMGRYLMEIRKKIS
jgi:predicted NAD-dependent protein-ADP-ribosyltransferase YbiA (DUF1768 family)